MTVNTLPKNALTLFNLIQFLAQNDRGHCYAGNSYFSRKIGVTEKTIQKYIRLLNKYGCFEIDHGGAGRVHREISVLINYTELTDKIKAAKPASKKISVPMEPNPAPIRAPKLLYREFKERKEPVTDFKNFDVQKMRLEKMGLEPYQIQKIYELPNQARVKSLIHAVYWERDDPSIKNLPAVAYTRILQNKINRYDN